MNIFAFVAALAVSFAMPIMAAADVLYLSVEPGGRVMPFDSATLKFGAPIVSPAIPADPFFVTGNKQLLSSADGSFIYLISAGSGSVAPFAYDAVRAYAVQGERRVYVYPKHVVDNSTQTLALGPRCGSVAVWSTTMAEVIAHLTIYSSDLDHAIADGPTLTNRVDTDAAASGSDEIYVLDGPRTLRRYFVDGNTVRSDSNPLADFDGDATKLALNADESMLDVMTTRDIEIIDARTMRRIRVMRPPAPPTMIAPAPNGDYLYVLLEQPSKPNQIKTVVWKHIAMIERATGRIVWQQEVYRNPNPGQVDVPFSIGLYATPDGKRLVFVSQFSMDVLDAQSGKPVKHFGLPKLSYPANSYDAIDGPTFPRGHCNR